MEQTTADKDGRGKPTLATSVKGTVTKPPEELTVRVIAKIKIPN